MLPLQWVVATRAGKLMVYRSWTSKALQDINQPHCRLFQNKWSCATCIQCILMAKPLVQWKWKQVLLYWGKSPPGGMLLAKPGLCCRRFMRACLLQPKRHMQLNSNMITSLHLEQKLYLLTVATVVLLFFNALTKHIARPPFSPSCKWSYKTKSYLTSRPFLRLRMINGETTV